jgi:predicted MFS family arabinose efflux permease
MKNPPSDSPIHRRFAPTALMFGNLITGCSVLAPAGMLIELSSDLGVTVHTAGLLVTFGAVMLCVGSPLTAWLTSWIERRTLLTVTLAVLAFGNLASAFAPDYTILLVTRLIMLAIGALYTPQAAGTAALIVSPERRGGTIAYVFLGWSLAAAVGLPLITFITSRYGWRAAYGGIGFIGFIGFLLLAWRLPAGLIGARVDLKTWSELARNRAIIVLLLITTLLMSGQFAVFTYMGPLLAKLTHVGPDAVGLVFAIYGVCGFIGIAICQSHRRFVGRLPDVGLVHLAGADRHHGLGAERRHLSADGVLGRDLGIGVCLEQLDAAGSAGQRGAGLGLGLRVAQYVGALCGPGHRFGDRRIIVCPRTLVRHRLCRCGLCRAGADDGDLHA